MTSISVVIPTHNDPETLPKTIASIREQTFQDYEVIVVNDGGTSPSKFVDFSDKRFRLIDLPNNKGVGNARNIGFRESSGEIIYFLDSDDLIAKDLLEFAHANMRENNYGMLAVLHTPIPLEEVSNRKDLLEVKNRTAGFKEMNPKEFCEAFRRKTQNFLPSTIFFRRSAMLDVAGEFPWDTSTKNGADTLIIFRIGAHREVLQSLDRFVIYSVRSNSLSRKNELATWSARVTIMDIFLNDKSSQKLDGKIIDTAFRIRQNAARKVARVHKKRGEKTKGVGILIGDIKRRPNLKSMAEMVRLYFPST